LRIREELSHGARSKRPWARRMSIGRRNCGMSGAASSPACPRTPGSVPSRGVSSPTGGFPWKPSTACSVGEAGTTEPGPGAG
jgi:hypothetical protein